MLSTGPAKWKAIKYNEPSDLLFILQKKEKEKNAIISAPKLHWSHWTHSEWIILGFSVYFHFLHALFPYSRRDQIHNAREGEEGSL